MKLRTGLALFTVGMGTWFVSAPANGQAPDGQAPKAGSDWHHVMALPQAVSIDVQSTGGHLRCRLTQVTDDSLVCSRGATPSTFQRTDIRSIKISHRGRSALIGGAVGGGALGIAFFASATNSGDKLFGPNFLRGQATALGLGVGAAIGGGVGALTDFSKSTVYKAP